jgi:hypothetical protein
MSSSSAMWGARRSRPRCDPSIQNSAWQLACA